MKEFWLARDRDYDLFIYEKEPLKNEHSGDWILGGRFERLPELLFPEIRWEDKKPTKCIIEFTQ